MVSKPLVTVIVKLEIKLECKLKEVTVYKVSQSELTQRTGDWEMARKACNIPLFVNLGNYEGPDNIQGYSILQGSQNINSIAQGIAHSNLLLSLLTC